MTAVVHLSDKELAELQAFTKETDAATALRLAMQEFIRAAKRERLKALAGQVEMVDNWQDLENQELREQDGSRLPGAD